METHLMLKQPKYGNKFQAKTFQFWKQIQGRNAKIWKQILGQNNPNVETNLRPMWTKYVNKFETETGSILETNVMKKWPKYGNKLEAKIVTFGKQI